MQCSAVSRRAGQDRTRQGRAAKEREGGWDGLADMGLGVVDMFWRYCAAA